MKRILFLIIFSCLCIFAYSQTDEERILSYDADIVIHTSSDIAVTEKIKVKSNANQIDHGIFRIIPNRRDINGRNYPVKYKILSVKRDGKEEPYHTESGSGVFSLYIGDADVSLPPGIYDYEIQYTANHQIGYFENYDELYWNVNGNEWVFTIDKVTATVHLPDGAQIIQTACYTGSAGSTFQDCQVQEVNENTVKWTADSLSYYHGLTVAVGFTKGILAEPQLPVFLQTGFLSKWLSGLLAVLAGIMVYFWNKFGRDFDEPTIYPQFDIPNGYSPASLGYILNESYSGKFSTISIVNLAVKKYIQVKEESTKTLFGKKRSTYTLKKLRDADYSLPNEEKTLLSMLFPSNTDEVSIDGSYQPHIEKAISQYRMVSMNETKDLLKKGRNADKVGLLFSGITLVYWAIILYNHFTFQNSIKMTVAVVLFAFCFFMFIFLIASKTASAKIIWIVPSLIMAAAGYFYQKYFGINDGYDTAYYFFAASMIMLGIFNYFIRQPGTELLEAKSKIKGFKMYLETAESEIIKYFNPPQLTPELFEKYLPYAIALGVSGVWGKKFESKMTETGTNYQSNWYSGSNMTGFSSGMINSFSNSFASNMSGSSTAPSSSSGSGGGGSSGGGGGGGGGGGW